MRFIKAGKSSWFNIEDISSFHISQTLPLVVEVFMTGMSADERCFIVKDEEASQFLEGISKCVAYVDDTKPVAPTA